MKNARSQASPGEALVDALLLCTTQHRLSPIFSPCSGLGHGLFLLPIVYSRTAGPCILQQSAPSTGNHSVHKLVIQFFNGSVLSSMSKVLSFGLGFIGSGPSAGIYCTKSLRSFPHQQGTPSPDDVVAIAVAEMEASSQGIKQRELLARLFPKGPIACNSVPPQSENRLSVFRVYRETCLLSGALRAAWDGWAARGGSVVFLNSWCFSVVWVGICCRIWFWFAVLLFVE